jgi:FMN phosphatase YigB (HAD superfamily)
MHATIFDIDGTLLRSAAVDDALYRQAVRAVLGDVFLRPTLHDYDVITDTGIFHQILDDNQISAELNLLHGIRSAFVDLLQAYAREHGPFEEIPGAKKLLRRLQRSPQHAVALATGGWRESAELKLQSAGFDCAEIPLATSNDHHERAVIMEIALAQLGEGVKTVTYYGDGPWDRDACRSLGWEFVAVGPDLGGLEHFQDLNICK